MATYKQIKEYVKERRGYTPNGCWIAHVKASHGLVPRASPNRRFPGKRLMPCPPDKWRDIEAALSRFDMI